jgi:hypothetical protein
MRLKSLWVLTAGSIIAALLANVFAGGGAASPGDGAVSDDGSVWQVRYHKDNKSKKTNDAALRLRIEKSDKTGAGADDIKGTLTRYDDVDTAAGKYKRRDKTKGGEIVFYGTITKRGGGSGRKREEFELLDGTYNDGQAHTVTIRGFHHGGQDRKSRGDDYLCIRINDKLATKAAAGARVPYVDCDEQPPDEDNLSDEPIDPDPPNYP